MPAPVASDASASLANPAPIVETTSAARTTASLDTATTSWLASATTTASTPAPAATATGQVAPVADPAPSSPVEQLVSVLRPLRTQRDGSYRIDLELRPPELGRIELRVEMRDGVLHASLRAEHDAAAQVVRDSLAELRVQLDRDGISAGRLNVDSGRAGFSQRENHELPDRAPTEGHEPTPTSSPQQATTGAAGTTSLDVRI
jgi:flagellar hook-length control protein FliK